LTADGKQVTVVLVERLLTVRPRVPLLPLWLPSPSYVAVRVGSTSFAGV
jgi:hypothetical protein